MKYRGKLLAFLATWFATIGVAFLLPNLEAFAANCNACTWCETYDYAALYVDGVLILPAGYFDPVKGTSSPQAFDGTSCGDSGGDLYQAAACGGAGRCRLETTNGSLKVKEYDVPSFTCTLPAGATPVVQEFTGGSLVKSLGMVVEYVCYGE